MKVQTLIKIFVVLFVLVPGAIGLTVYLRGPGGSSAKGDYLNYDRSLEEVMSAKQADSNRIRILIQKSNRKLTVFSVNDPLKSYPISLGFNPVEDKLREGDGCTPEGVFSVKEKSAHFKWRRLILLDYPTDDSWKKHLRAKEMGKIKRVDNIGGNVGINGVPEGMDSLVAEGQHWTSGNISMKNADIEEVFKVVRPGTPVEILP